jgi:nucleoside 2-deoxyribosyltransferase
MYNETQEKKRSVRGWKSVLRTISPMGSRSSDQIYRNTGEVFMQIYFAGPLFCQAELAFNRQLTKELEERGFKVFLPQRDGIERAMLSESPYLEMNDVERCRAIFSLDRDKVLGADIFLFVLDGRVPDEGACVELGIAYSQKFLLGREKLLVGLKTDDRVAFPDVGINAMILGALDVVTENQADLIAALEAYRHNRVDG